MNIRVLTTEYLLYYAYHRKTELIKEKTTMRQISIKLKITYKQVFLSFKELEKQGLVTLKKLNNRRDKLIILTSKADALMNTSFKNIRIAKA